MATEALPPQVASECARFTARLRRRHYSAPQDIARKTVEIMRQLVGCGSVKDIASLIELIKRTGAMLVAAQPHELVIGNMVRRVLAIVREESAHGGQLTDLGGDAARGAALGVHAALSTPGLMKSGSAPSEAAGCPGAGVGPSLIKMLDAPAAPDYLRQTLKVLRGPLIEAIGELLEELVAASSHISEQARKAPSAEIKPTEISECVAAVQMQGAFVSPAPRESCVASTLVGGHGRLWRRVEAFTLPCAV
eukprot:6019452-Pleurochrysis_carterae.AAC.2